ncbi:hypothetical protein [uncultured Shewanella sp.]|uniref:hypothetical protein n=1 Tax=uncultured Shewanella sp. TaxID=173975 RepID=UPI002632D3BE|nr:hypothetical protein [uncultured Shewanella sp.]
MKLMTQYKQLQVCGGTIHSKNVQKKQDPKIIFKKIESDRNNRIIKSNIEFFNEKYKSDKFRKDYCGELNYNQCLSKKISSLVFPM